MGHTYMMCDSIHAAIMIALRRREYCADLVQLLEEVVPSACKDPPHNIETLHAGLIFDAKTYYLQRYMDRLTGASEMYISDALWLNFGSGPDENGVECAHPDEVWLRDSLDPSAPIRRANLCRWMSPCNDDGPGQVRQKYRGASNPMRAMLDDTCDGGYDDPLECRLTAKSAASDSDDSDDDAEPTDADTRYEVSVIKRFNLAQVARALPAIRLPASRTLDAYGDELEDDPDLGYATYRQLFPMPSKEELATLKAADRAEADV